jgi:antitoxin component YwqK of YwqJK toxin-antitoxin module
METKIERDYYENGKPWSEQPYVDGKLHGIWKWWYPSGKLSSEATYVDGVRHGMQKWWHPNGNIDEFWLYNQGEVVAKFYPKNETQRWKLK